MIYTITINPALDYLMKFENKIDHHQITNDAEYLIGGKGINASILLNNLKMSNQAIVVLGGYNGKKFSEIAKNQKIKIKKIEIANETRINVKSNFSNKTYEQNFLGNEVNPIFINKKILYFLKDISFKDSVLFMGSCPPGYKIDNIEEIIKYINKKNAKFILDIPILKIDTLFKYQPELIKPNIKELESIFKTKINLKKVHKYAYKLIKLGAQRVLISLDKKGALYFDKNNNQFKIKVPKINEINGSGSGDSMIAAFKYCLNKKKSLNTILKFSAGAGVATATTPGIANKQKILKYEKLIEVNKYNV